jgi:hypothetical protein
MQIIAKLFIRLSDATSRCLTWPMMVSVTVCGGWRMVGPNFCPYTSTRSFSSCFTKVKYLSREKTKHMLCTRKEKSTYLRKKTLHEKQEWKNMESFRMCSKTGQGTVTWTYRHMIAAGPFRPGSGSTSSFDLRSSWDSISNTKNERTTKNV